MLTNCRTFLGKVNDHQLVAGFDRQHLGVSADEIAKIGDGIFRLHAFQLVDDLHQLHVAFARQVFEVDHRNPIRPRRVLQIHHDQKIVFGDEGSTLVIQDRVDDVDGFAKRVAAGRAEVELVGDLCFGQQAVARLFSNEAKDFGKVLISKRQGKGAVSRFSFRRFC